MLAGVIFISLDQNKHALAPKAKATCSIFHSGANAAVLNRGKDTRWVSELPPRDTDKLHHATMGCPRQLTRSLSKLVWHRTAEQKTVAVRQE